MTWQDLAQPQSAAVVQSAVQISCGPASGKTTSMQDRLTITFRPDVMGEESAWIQRGARVRVLQGSGEHAGMIRIVSDAKGTMTLHGAGGRPGSTKPRPMLVLRGLAWIPHERRRPVAVDHDAGAGWIEVTLPDWCAPERDLPTVAKRAAPDEPAEVAPAAKPPAPQPKARSKGRSFVDHLPDPAAQGRRSSAPVHA